MTPDTVSQVIPPPVTMALTDAVAPGKSVFGLPTGGAPRVTGVTMPGVSVV